MQEFTVKQIAELLGVSKPTVQKKIKLLAVSPERKDNRNTAYYSYANTVKIITAISPSFEDFDKLAVGEKPPTEPPTTAKDTAKPPIEPPITDNQTAKPPSEELEILKEALRLIEEQLKDKKKIIEMQQKTIDGLQDRLAEAMQLNKGQQYIAAADKTTELLEANNRRSQMQEEQTIIVNESDTEEDEEESSSLDRINQNKEVEEPEPQKKVSFWKRLFG